MASADPGPAYPPAGPSTAAFFAEPPSDDDSEATDLLRASRGAPTYTAEEEAAVVKKFDRKLVVFVALLYMFSFLDRSSTLPCPLRPFTPSYTLTPPFLHPPWTQNIPVHL